MRQAGFYLPPAQFEVGFVSAAHTDDEIQSFVRSAAAAFGRLRTAGEVA
jgi:glutamate-1-semialdehyde aminotransferase